MSFLFPSPRAALVTLAAGATVALSLQACGGDTIGDATSLFTDGGPTTDATVADTGAPDSAVDASNDAGFSCAVGQIQCGSACFDPTSDGNNCGTCGNACVNGTVCSQGKCATSCTGSLVACGASCIDTATDANNCGACGTTCAAGQVCTAGQCTVTCQSGETLCTATTSDAGADAGDAAADGGAASYCIDAHTDHQNCGGCGIVCGAGQVCSGGTCATTCSPDFVDCNGSCIDPTSSRTFCGATAGCGAAGTDAASTAGTACANGQVCSAGVCAVTCAAGLVECNGTCVDPRSNPNFCGATTGCGVTAGSAGTICTQGQVCTGLGTCQTSCAVNQVLCGTECIDPLNSNAACGAKGDCKTTDANDSPGVACTGGKVCSNGTCGLTCAAGDAVCSSVCVNGQTDSTHCGAKGNCTTTDANDNPGKACPAGQFCSGGTCSITCQATQAQCGTDCVDPATNLTFCGAVGKCDGTAGNSKGTTCAAGQVCSNGTCATVCGAGLTKCGSVCVNELTDNENCGACGTACADGTVCTLGSCKATCTGTLQVCSNACVDEQNDPAHCGGCDPCMNGTDVAITDCRSGACAIGVCTAGFADCNGTYMDGCEVNTQTDENNCGGCGNVCNGTCTGGACAYTSCANALALNPGAASGVYTLQPPGVTTPFQAYCDMTRDSGGWTLIMKTTANTTFAFDAMAWTDGTTLNTTDLSITNVADAKYASFLSVPITTAIRGEFPQIASPYRFQQTVSGGVTAQTLFQGGQQSVTPFPFVPPTPPFNTQPNCQYFGINSSGPNAGSHTVARFGWTANNEGDCTSNDTIAGFGIVYESGGENHGSGFVCQSSQCSGSGDEDVGAFGLLWVK